MRTIVFIIGAVLLAILAWGIEQATIAPLETGDVYPPYSSLRSDPLGAKALYESLAALGSIEVERLYKQRPTIAASDTMFMLGVEPVSWSASPVRALEEYEKSVANGGRLVIAFVPVRTPKKLSEKREVEQRWNIKLHYAKIDDPEGDSIPAETVLYFQPGPEWRGIPDHIAVERRFGAGSIVLVADTFALSNQGLRDARDTGFIAKLIGPAKRVVFDETHLGVVETGSIAKLMHKYRLEGAVAILALAAALFLWRTASSFLPPRTVAASNAVAGRDSIAGMTALLYRGVKQKDLMETCFAQWTKSAPRKSRAARVEDEIRRLKNDPVAAYRAASQALTEKR